MLTPNKPATGALGLIQLPVELLAEQTQDGLPWLNVRLSQLFRGPDGLSFIQSLNSAITDLLGPASKDRPVGEESECRGTV